MSERETKTLLSTEGKTSVDKSVIEESNKKECTDKGRYRWFNIILYPDNEVHMKVLDYLEESDIQGFYIKHEPDELNSPLAKEKGGESKEHIHCALYFPNPRSVEGVRKSFGKCLLRKTSDGLKAILDPTGISEDEITIDYIFGKKLVSGVNDIRSLATYFTHSNFESQMLGKKQYKITDIVCLHRDFDILQKALEFENNSRTGSQFLRISEYVENMRCNSLRELMKTLCINGEVDLVKYVEGHSYLIKCTFFS